MLTAPAENGHDPLDLHGCGAVFEQPEGREIIPLVLLGGERKHLAPRISVWACADPRQSGNANTTCDVQPNRMAFIAMNSALALLEFDGRARQVPMHNGMAPGMKIQTLLTYRGRGEQERPKRRVEGGSHRVEPADGAVGLLDLSKPQRMPASEMYCIQIVSACAAAAPVRALRSTPDEGSTTHEPP